MKNFLELLATDPKIDIEIRLSVIKENGAPHCVVKVNDSVLYHGHQDHDLVLSSQVSVTDTIEIVVTMDGKQYSGTKETAIILQSISVDGFAIVPNWTHLARYDNDQGHDQPTSYLGFNGTWRFAIDQPFHVWKHHVTGQGWLLEPITTARD